MKKVNIKRKYYTGSNSVNTNYFKDTPDYYEMQKLKMKSDNAGSAYKTVATTAVDAFAPGVGTALGAADGIAGKFTKDKDGNYKSTTAKNLAQLNPLTKGSDMVGHIATGNWEGLANDYSYGLLGESDKTQFEREKKKADDIVAARKYAESYAGNDMTKNQKVNFKMGTKKVKITKRYEGGSSEIEDDAKNFRIENPNTPQERSVPKQIGLFYNRATNNSDNTGGVGFQARKEKRDKKFNSRYSDEEFNNLKRAYVLKGTDTIVDGINEENFDSNKYSKVRLGSGIYGDKGSAYLDTKQSKLKKLDLPERPLIPEKRKELDLNLVGVTKKEIPENPVTSPVEKPKNNPHKGSRNVKHFYNNKGQLIGHVNKENPKVIQEVQEGFYRIKDKVFPRLGTNNQRKMEKGNGNIKINKYFAGLAGLAGGMGAMGGAEGLAGLSKMGGMQGSMEGMGNAGGTPNMGGGKMQMVNQGLGMINGLIDKFKTPTRSEVYDAKRPITNGVPQEDVNKYTKGGLIKRADGSYSRHGLWDSIRENKGSGRKPTKEMLEQERKINNKYPDGSKSIKQNSDLKKLSLLEQYKKNKGGYARAEQGRVDSEGNITDPLTGLKYKAINAQKKIKSGNVNNIKKTSYSQELRDGIVVDKRKNKAIVLNKDGKNNYEYDVLTGKNVELNSNSLKSDNPSMSTPYGYYKLSDKGINKKTKSHYNNNINFLNPIEHNGLKKPDVKQLAYHQTADPKVRDKLYGTDKANVSYGCINARGKYVEASLKDIQKDDTLLVLDSNIPEHKVILEKYQSRVKPKDVNYFASNKQTEDKQNMVTSNKKFKQGGMVTKYAKGGTVWTRKEGQNPDGGLNQKGRDSYNKANGANLKAPQPEGGSRRDSFCARMGGMKKKLTSAKTANDPDSRINKALRKWKCEDGKTISKNVVIEIEGKGTPEIHTDKNFNIKNFGSIPHSKGGNKVLAKDGDVVFPTQNNHSKFMKIVGLIAAGDKKALEKERQKLPSDKSEKYADGGKNVVIRGKGSKQQRDINLSGRFPNALTGDEGIQVAPSVKDKKGNLTVPAWKKNKFTYNNQRSNEDFAKLKVAYVKKGTDQVDPSITKDTEGYSKVRMGDGKHGDLNTPYLDDRPTAVQQEKEKEKEKEQTTETQTKQTEEVKTENKKEEVKPKDSPMPYVNELNNLYQSNTPVYQAPERYYTPELYQYQDKSDPNRRAALENKNISVSNARNIGSGNAGNVRANMANALATQYGQTADINNFEATQSTGIANANVDVKNDAQKYNLPRYDMYNDAKEQRLGIKQRYFDQAMKGTDDKLMLRRQEGYQKQLDAKNDANQKQYINNLRTANYKNDDEGNIITDKGNSANNNNNNNNVISSSSSSTTRTTSPLTTTTRVIPNAVTSQNSMFDPSTYNPLNPNYKKDLVSQKKYGSKKIKINKC